MSEARLPQEAEEMLAYLRDNRFVVDAPTPESVRLREIAADYAGTLTQTPVIKAVFLTGSAVTGTAGPGSDIDIQVVVDGPDAPLRKYMYRDTPVDLTVVSFKQWEERFIHGDRVRLLTNAIPLYARPAEILIKQRYAMEEYYAKETFARERARVERLVGERAALGKGYLDRGLIPIAVVCLESCLLEAMNLLIYRYRGMPSPSVVLAELKRIGSTLEHADWHDRTVQAMRFGMASEQYRDLVAVYGTLYEVMRERLAPYSAILTRMARLEMGPYNAARDLVDHCSETSHQQLQDRVERAILRHDEHNAGMALFLASHQDFFRFSPLFYMKNVDRTVRGSAMVALPLEIVYDSWDDDVKNLWKGVARTGTASPHELLDLKALSEEILSCCS
jgi:predicted nucleotidyltransferase